MIYPDKMVRPWVATICYPGFKPMTFGTVVLPVGLRHDQIMDALLNLAKPCFPPGFIVSDPRCGAIFLQEYDE